ncbi:MAG: hypothetical protein FWC50_08755 [Planctomycetaceae bacterium]|nr:hypothetical protein [Planctomycetaceae bacterium]
MITVVPITAISRRNEYVFIKSPFIVRLKNIYWHGIGRLSAVLKEYNHGSVFIVTPETFTGERDHEIDRDSDG